MVIHHEGVLQFPHYCVLFDPIIVLIKAIHRSPPKVPLALFFYFASFSTFSAFGYACSTMAPRPHLRVQLVNTFPPYRVLPEFALHFCRISALSFCSFVCFHTAISLPSHGAEMPC
ncbi:hypothetical protein EUGRSUZ_L03333 [Eucalyptus grandis]|uniref:Uncharacterized protein n=1 Tax=Eucalyptus grandis TaxID=71139 RepID=A0AAD9T8I1_EUCGR|nr:hypothetical protein EUGRSUZ_L03333 [Eucalyptus grandis]